MSIGTALTIGEIATTAAGAGMSFAQSSKQRELQKSAEAQAKASMIEAKKKLETNFYKNLGIVKEPYQLEREADMAIAAATLQAGQESRRGVAGVAGQVVQANNIAQRNIAGQMGNDMFNINKMVAAENQNLNEQKIGLDIGTAQGAQLAASNNNALANQSFMQGMQGVTSLAGKLAELPALYGNKNITKASTTPLVTDATNPQQTFPNSTPNPTPNPQSLVTNQNLDLATKYQNALQNNLIRPSLINNLLGADGKPLPLDQVLKKLNMTEAQFEIFLNKQ